VVTRTAGTPSPVLIAVKSGVGPDRSSMRDARGPAWPAAVRASSIRKMA
jgi:hypothetical protein